MQVLRVVVMYCVMSVIPVVLALRRGTSTSSTMGVLLVGRLAPAFCLLVAGMCSKLPLTREWWRLHLITAMVSSHHHLSLD